MGKIGRMYKILQRLQRSGEYKNCKTIMHFTEEDFKGHLEKITHERYESSPEQILKTIEKVEGLTVEELTVEDLTVEGLTVEDLTVEEETLERKNELIVQNPSFEQI